jgi:hypothetical protein
MTKRLDGQVRKSERIRLCYYPKCSLCYITAHVGELNGLMGPLKKKINVTKGRYTQTYQCM